MTLKVPSSMKRTASPPNTQVQRTVRRQCPIEDFRLLFRGQGRLKSAYWRYGVTTTLILWFFALLGKNMEPVTSRLISMSSSARFFLVCSVLMFTVPGRSNTQLDPCSLLSVSEAQFFDASISISRAFPPQGVEKNDLCLYYNVNGDPRLMVFVWSDPTIDPVDATKAGMIEGDSTVVDVTGVGEKAAAGFESGQLKLFAAQTATE